MQVKHFLAASYAHLMGATVLTGRNDIPGFVIDEAANFPPKRGSEKSYTLPPKHRGENRKQYRRRLRESGLIG